MTPLRRDRDRLAERLRQAERIIEVQKEVFGLLDATTSPTVGEKTEGSQRSSFAKISESPWHVVP